MQAPCPTHNPFRVDKTKSLEIVAEILKHFTVGDDQISLNENMKWFDHYSDEADNLVEYRHKLGVVEIDVSDGTIRNWETTDVDAIPDAFYAAIAKHSYEKSDQIEIHSGSQITPSGEINLSAYLHNTSAECDVSYPMFTYDELFGCWIVKESFWGAAGGVDGNGNVLVLDFSSYT